MIMMASLDANYGHTVQTCLGILCYIFISHVILNLLLFYHNDNMNHQCGAI